MSKLISILVAFLVLAVVSAEECFRKELGRVTKRAVLRSCSG